DRLPAPADRAALGRHPPGRRDGPALPAALRDPGPSGPANWPSDPDERPVRGSRLQTAAGWAEPGLVRHAAGPGERPASRRQDAVGAPRERNSAAGRSRALERWRGPPT